MPTFAVESSPHFALDTPEERANRSANANLFRLVYAFRSYGHLVADLDPLGIQRKPVVPELDPKRYDIPESGQTFNLTGNRHLWRHNCGD